MQGKIETQGDYNDVLNSGIDIASIINDSKENLDEDCNEDNETTKNAKNSSNSLKKIDTSVTLINNEKNQSKDPENVPEEQKELLKELEASSKGKVKGPLILNYLKSAERPFTLVLLLVTFLLAQTLASVADIWVSYWYVVIIHSNRLE